MLGGIQSPSAWALYWANARDANERDSFQRGLRAALLHLLWPLFSSHVRSPAANGVIGTSCPFFSLFFINTHLCLSPICLFLLLKFPLPCQSVSLPLSPLLPPLLCFHALHTCSGTGPCASKPWQGGEQTAPVFSDNHHIARMPAPLPLSLFFLLSPAPRLPAYLSQAHNRPRQPRLPPPQLSLAASARPYISLLTGSLSTHNASVSFFSPFVVTYINCSCQLQNRRRGWVFFLFTGSEDKTSYVHL